MRIALLVGAAVVLAGCAGSPGNKSGTGGAAGGNSPEVADGLPLPVWAIRDFWTYSIGDETASFVVTGESGADWVVGTDSLERAFQDARDDISRLGPQRKSDLAGSQGDERVEFFHWPLTDGLNWTTTWDHQPVTIKAQVNDGKAILEATDANATLVYRYTYDSAVRWISQITHFNPDGSELIGLKLTASGHNYMGDIVRWDLEPIIKASGDLAFQSAYSSNFQVPLTATDVWASMTLSCSSGTLLLGVSPMPVVTTLVGVDPRGMGGGGTPCPLEFAFTGSVGEPRAPAQGGTSEAWGWSIVGPPGGVGTYSIEVLVRTLETTAVG